MRPFLGKVDSASPASARRNTSTTRACDACWAVGGKRRSARRRRIARGDRGSRGAFTSAWPATLAANADWIAPLGELAVTPRATAVRFSAMARSKTLTSAPA